MGHGRKWHVKSREADPNSEIHGPTYKKEQSPAIHCLPVLISLLSMRARAPTRGAMREVPNEEESRKKKPIMYSR